MDANSFLMKHLDAHTHVQFADFDSDRDAVILRARDAGVGIIAAGSSGIESKKAVALASTFTEGVYACVGLHPGHTYISAYGNEEAEVFDHAFYKTLAENEKVVGIGECGLDYFKLENNNALEIKKNQEKVFLEHAALSFEVKKPLVIHCRDAYEDMKIILRAHKDLLACPPVMHFFAGTKDDARDFLDLGFYFTFGGVITFPPKKNMPPMYDEVIKFIPIDRIFSETDAPDVAPVPYRGKRSEPVFVLEVEKRLAAIKGVSEEEMAMQILQNMNRVFKIKI